MPNTYSQIVFAVKGRQNFIKESFREEVQKYMSGIINNKKQKLYAIYCMSDQSQPEKAVNYILNQPIHHKKKSFREEYHEFLENYDIAFDEKYVFEFYD
jgi:putative transposase